MNDLWTRLGSVVASLFFVWSMAQRYFPRHLQVLLQRRFQKIAKYFDPYIEINFHEFSGDRYQRSQAYSAIVHYLCSKSTEQAMRLRADVLKDGQNFEVSMDEHEEVCDEYENVTLNWSLRKNYSTSKSSSNPTLEEKRCYKLTFLKKYRELITGCYLKYVLEKGNAIGVGKKQQKLYTNSPYEPVWSNAVFELPASFHTLAMDPNEKTRNHGRSWYIQ